MKRNKDVAFVLSVHENIFPDISRINLKWNGNHEIFDFDLDRFGKVVNCATASTSDRRFETRWRPTLAFVALF
jgi:hypothetical protein